MSDIPWEAWAVFVSAVLGGGGVLGYIANREDRAEKARAKAEDAPVTAAGRLKSLLDQFGEVTDMATAAMARAAAADEKADAARSEAAEARHQAKQAQSDVLGLVAYTRSMWVGITRGTVPPHPPIPHLIRHILTDDDFPPPPPPASGPDERESP
jgi:hypothetical protein